MKSILGIFLVFFVVSTNLLAQADQASLRTKQFNLDASWAASGYDVVAYFSGKPTKGNKSIVYTHQGVKYSFSSQSNLESFKKNPTRFEPQYGGWCAYAMGANGEKVEIDPESFKIVNDKLYLFYNGYFNDTRAKWNKDENNLKIKADQNWKKTYR